ncbi:hypothetical protein RBG61_01445 [Paludicola sp. MB14-C6]|nr:hypothetical protein [Paludicola sp. MB14-C6]WMJ23354.1 hypothetical protein RBG61_01445 [Paludicola sp. MB14-C6]
MNEIETNILASESPLLQPFDTYNLSDSLLLIGILLLFLIFITILLKRK